MLLSHSLFVRVLIIFLCTVVLSACGGGSSLPGKRTFTVSGSVEGLQSNSIVLQNNGSDDTTITQDGNFTFSKTIANGDNYSVTVKTQPEDNSIICTVNNASGRVADAQVEDVHVRCTDTSPNQPSLEFYSLGGTVTGLNGSGLILNNHDGKQVNINSNGSFIFPSSFLNGSTFNISVLTQPSSPEQICTLTNASGAISNSDHHQIGVHCEDVIPIENRYTIGGTVIGLSGQGLTLQNNGDQLTIMGDGQFTFSQSYLENSSYNVRLLAAPSQPNQECAIVNGSGTITSNNIENIIVTCTTLTYSLSGTLQGLQGSGLQINNNHGENINLIANGAFNFNIPLADASNYSVSVTNHPSNPSQICTPSNAAGQITGEDVTDILITCATNSYSLSGTISGLQGNGLILASNSGETVSIAQNGNFSFNQSLADSSNFEVTVSNAPSVPSQNCSIRNGSGQIQGRDINNINVTCEVNSFTVGGTITGLSSTVELQNNLSDQITLNTNGSFSFPTALSDLSSFNVSVASQPDLPNQTCSVTNGSGTLTGSDITSIEIHCTTHSYTVGGTVTGLNGQLVIQNNNSDSLTINSNGSSTNFTFTTPLEDFSNYNIDTISLPSSPNQSCAITNGSGTVQGSNVTDIAISCVTNQYSIGGNATGLIGSLVIQNNDSNDLLVTSDGSDVSFRFSTHLDDSSNYLVSILTNPRAPNQNCSVTQNASGTIQGSNIDNVQIQCSTDQYSVGGSVTGLNGSLVIQNNNSDNLTVISNGSNVNFTFPTLLDDASDYRVSVLTNPNAPNQTCAVTQNANGILQGGSINNIEITCSTVQYSIGGTVTGLNGSLTLQNNNSDNLTVIGNGSSVDFSFNTPLDDLSNYNISILTQPNNPRQSCSVTQNTSGTIQGSNINDVQIQCSNDQYSVGGTVTGLNGSLVLQNNNSDDLTVVSNGSDVNFTFSTLLSDESNYLVSILTNPSNPNQSCSVTANANGTIQGNNINTVEVSCTTNQYSVGGTVTGLDGSLVIQNNNSDNLTIIGNGPDVNFSFPTSLDDLSNYNVSILTEPSSPNQSCSVTQNANGTIQGSDINTVEISCTTNQYSVGGTVTGLDGSLVVQNNLTDNLTIIGNGSNVNFTFATLLDDTSNYSVSVLTNPSSPDQVCTVTQNATGSISGNNINNVQIDCSTASFYSVGGSVTGLNGQLIISNNGSDSLTLNSTGSTIDYTFDTFLANASNYDVQIVSVTATPAQSCQVTSNASGTINSSNVSNIAINCVNSEFTIGGTVSGLNGQLILQNNNNSEQITLNGHGATIDFTFPTRVSTSTNYDITVYSVVATPEQDCQISNGTGTISNQNITNISVSCSEPLASLDITTMSKANSISWSDIPGAEEYHLYVSTAPNCDIANYGSCPNGRLIHNASSPYLDTNLENGQAYFYTLGVYEDSSTSVASKNVGAKPMPLTPNEAVRAIEVDSDGTTYLGGSFTYVGPVTGRAAQIDTQTGKAKSLFPIFNNNVSAIVPDQKGGWYVGGDFSEVDGEPQRYLAHILPNGLLNTAWRPTLDGRVNALAFHNNVLYIGGEFDTVNGATRNYAAALDTQAELTSWNPNFDNRVLAMAINGSTIYIGGHFNMAGTQTRNYLAAVTTEGVITSWNPSANREVHAIEVMNNSVIVAGYFSAINSTDRDSLAAIDFNGVLTGWNPDVNGTTLSMTTHNNVLYIGGVFRNVEGQERQHLAAFNSNGSLNAWNPEANHTGWIYSMDASDGVIYVGGRFDTINNTERNQLAAITTGGVLTSWNPNVHAETRNVTAIATHKDTVYVGGTFNGVGGEARNRLAALASDGNLTNWNPNANNVVYSLMLSGNNVVVGGSFTTISGQARSKVAIIGKHGTLSSWRTGAIDGSVYTLALHNNILYIGGTFTSIASLPRNRLAALNVNGDPTDWAPQANDQVNDIEIYNGIIYVGGKFTEVNTETRLRLAAFNTNGDLTIWGRWVDGEVLSLDSDYVDGTARIYFAGDFDMVGTSPRQNLAAISTMNFVSDWAPTANHEVTAISVDNATNNIYIGGIFYQVNSTRRSSLAEIDSSGNLTNWNPGSSWFIYEIQHGSNDVYVGGWINTTTGDDGIPRMFLAPIPK